MKNTILFSLSVTLVACGGSFEQSEHGAEDLAGYQRITRGDDVVFIAVDPELSERIQVTASKRIGGGDEVVARENAHASATLTVVMKHPMQEEAVLSLINAMKLRMSCSTAGTWSPTVSKLRCLPADGSAMTTREIENLPELLAFTAGIDD